MRRTKRLFGFWATIISQCAMECTQYYSNAKVSTMQLSSSCLLVTISASSLERPLLWFVVIEDVFSCKMVTILAIKLLLAENVHLSLLSIWERLKPISLAVNETTDSYMTGGESWLVAKLFKLGMEYFLELRTQTLQLAHRIVEVSWQQVWELISCA